MIEKIRNLEEMTEIARKLKEEGKVLVTTNGSFDILHSAHANLLEKAKKEGDILIVLLNSDKSIKSYKGEKRPIIPEQERARMLAALEAVDYVVIFEEDKPLNCLEKIRAQKHIRGGTNFNAAERAPEEKKLTNSWGGEHKFFELEKGFSTTNIIERVLEVYKDGRK